jgi:hypothetical protein
MNNVKKSLLLVRLDLYTIKPYLTLKNLGIYIGVAFIVSYSSTGAGALIGMMMGFALMYTSYPFVVGEKSGMDILYAMLSVKRKSVVLGRYLFAFAFIVCVGVFAVFFSYVLLTARQVSFNAVDSFTTLLVLFLLFSVISAVQLPIFFRYGYTKAKFLAYLPFVMLPLIITFSSDVIGSAANFAIVAQVIAFFQWLAANALRAALLAAAAWLAIMAASYKISLAGYSKRDF